MYCGVLTSGIAMMNRVVERMALTAAEGHRVAQGTLNEASVFDHRTFPASNQSGVGVDDERGVAEPAGVQRDVGEVLCRPPAGWVRQPASAGPPGQLRGPLPDRAQWCAVGGEHA
ncbi:hypothetical protein A4G27_11225 [Mycobacterium kansasii]|nr:hypothetical protein A4G27_11225 [Mycobacterium kansasii]